MQAAVAEYFCSSPSPVLTTHRQGDCIGCLHGELVAELTRRRREGVGVHELVHHAAELNPLVVSQALFFLVPPVDAITLPLDFGRLLQFFGVGLQHGLHQL